MSDAWIRGKAGIPLSDEYAFEEDKIEYPLLKDDLSLSINEIDEVEVNGVEENKVEQNKVHEEVTE